MGPGGDFFFFLFLGGVGWGLGFWGIWGLGAGWGGGAFSVLFSRFREQRSLKSENTQSSQDLLIRKKENSVL